jgi:hypothetical protein
MAACSVELPVPPRVRSVYRVGLANAVDYRECEQDSLSPVTYWKGYICESKSVQRRC